MDSVITIVHYLSSRECAGRRVGTPGWKAAQNYIVDQLQSLQAQPLFGNELTETLPALGGAINGANILGVISGKGLLKDRFILIEAHYDHLGEDEEGLEYYPGADDNAAAVAIILNAVHLLQRYDQPMNCRSIIIASFDAEEPPYFNSDDMGAERFCQMHSEYLERIDLAIVLDLMGHAMGYHQECSLIQESFFITGAEKTKLGPVIDAFEHKVQGLFPHRIGNHTIPPLGNYLSFQKRNRPFLFFTSGRSKDYHSIFDSAEKLDYPKITRVTEYMSLLLHRLLSLDPSFYEFDPQGADDKASLKTLRDLYACLGTKIPEHDKILHFIEESMSVCEQQGNLNEFERSKLNHLLGILEKHLS